MNIVIIGASRGIGRATALRFAQLGRGVELVLTYASNLPAMQQTAAECGELGAVVRTVQLDLNSPARGIAYLENSVDQVDVLINNAAILERGKLDEVSDSQLERILRINVSGPYNVTRALLKHLRGFVFNFGSDAAIFGRPNLLTYCISKGAIQAMTRCLAQDYPHLQVYNINPGMTATDMSGGGGQPPQDVAEAIFAVANGSIKLPSGTDINVGPVYDQESVPDSYIYRR